MKNFLKKTLSTTLILAVAQLSFVPASQAFWGQDFWSALSANVFSLSEEDLPSGLFFDWEESMPEGSVIMAYQNSENFNQAADSVVQNLEKTIESASETEEGALLAMMAGGYLEMLKGMTESLDRVQAAEVFIQYDLEKLKAITQDYEEVVVASMTGDPFAGFDAFGMCLTLRLNADADIINLVTENLPTAGEGEEDLNFSINKQAESIQVSLGCQSEVSSILPTLPENVNFIAFQTGMDLEAFYEIEAESDAISKTVFGFYNRLREINAQRVAEDLNAGAFLLSLEPGGYKTQLVASLKNKDRADLLKRYWSGGVLKKPFFMNENAKYDTQLLEFSGLDREYVFLEERFSQLDWTHWYGKMQETSLAALPILATMGVVAASTLQGYTSEAYQAQSRAFISSASTVIKVEQAVNDPYVAPTTKEEIMALFENQGLFVPDNQEQCHYYIHSLNKPAEFAIFTNTDPVMAEGSEKMSNAIEKIFSQRELTCDTPEIQGSLIFKLN